jgi:anti-sigma regulatory factor (Ser/Thr protein kinase)
VPQVRETSNGERVTLVQTRFTVRQLQRLRLLVTRWADRVGMDAERRQRLTIAVTEAAGNVIRHGGGGGRFQLIKDDNRALIAEISDSGPGMAVRRPIHRPAPEATAGRGLYLIEQTCDRVEYHSGPAGTTVRLHMDLGLS